MLKINVVCISVCSLCVQTKIEMAHWKFDKVANKLSNVVIEVTRDDLKQASGTILRRMVDFVKTAIEQVRV